MRQAITFGDESYFAVELDALVVGRALSFPLFIHLPLNHSMIPRFAIGEIPSEDEIRRYRSKRLEFFACPERFHDQYVTYRAEAAADEGLVLYRAGNLDPEQKRALLMGIGRDMVKLITHFGDVDESSRRSALRRVSGMTRDIVRVGLQTHRMRSVYEDLALLSEAHVEHSTAVSTIAVIFALTVGFVDEADLADIAMAGFVHDVGLALAPPALWEKAVNEYTAAELEIYRAHPDEGVRILDTLPDDVTPLVRRAVHEHHERYDGGGFPRDLSGLDIDERVQIVAFADLVNDLMDGRITGQRLNPVEALGFIAAEQEAARKVVSLEIFGAVDRVVRAGRA